MRSPKKSQIEYIEVPVLIETPEDKDRRRNQERKWKLRNWLREKQRMERMKHPQPLDKDEKAAEDTVYKADLLLRKDTTGLYRVGKLKGKNLILTVLSFTGFSFEGVHDILLKTNKALRHLLIANWKAYKFYVVSVPKFKSRMPFNITDYLLQVINEPFRVHNQSVYSTVKPSFITYPKAVLNNVRPSANIKWRMQSHVKVDNAFFRRLNLAVEEEFLGVEGTYEGDMDRSLRPHGLGLFMAQNFNRLNYCVLGTWREGCLHGWAKIIVYDLNYSDANLQNYYYEGEFMDEESDLVGFKRIVAEAIPYDLRSYIPRI